MKKVAIIDIGSKSIKFFVGEKAEDGSIRTILDTNDIAALGEGLSKTGRISDEALERNAQSVATFAAKARELGAEKIVSVGTMALRSAENSADFVARVKELCNVDVQIIPGEEEARLSYLAVLSGLPLKDGELVIFDTGGGSTEFIFGRGKELKNRFSVNLGSNRITEDFFADDPVKEGSVEKAVAQIDKEFAEAGVNGKPAQLVRGVSRKDARAPEVGAVVADVFKYSAVKRPEAANELPPFRTINDMQPRKRLQLRVQIGKRIHFFAVLRIDPL